jgi:V/A-type H+-transporting ATPase subunit E
MQTKLQELTEKIYNEGVQKAHEEAEAILNDARQKAANIENEASKNAESIVSEARQKAEVLKKHVESELKMSVSQAVLALKQELTGLITLKAIQPPVKEVFGDKVYLQNLVELVVKGWTQKESFDLQVVLPEQNRTQMENYFKNQLATEMNKGLEIVFSDGLKSGFKIGPSNGSYVISFTDQDFMNFFKAYLRPKTTELLFEANK